MCPYYLTAVRTGNLAKFGDVLEHYGPRFQTEGTYTLIVRLRHNVIKTGVRMINLSYARISLADIARKLLLDSPEDAEFIVAKVGGADMLQQLLYIHLFLHNLNDCFFIRFNHL